MVRSALVTATSLALTGAVVAHAYLLKHQFYPTVVYLTKSSPSMAVRALQSLLPVMFLFNSGRMKTLLCFSGVVHSGLCSGVSSGKVYEKSIFWAAESCRNGGISFRTICHIVVVALELKSLDLLLMCAYPSASDWALMVCCNRDVPGLYCVQRWFLSSFCCPLHPPALPEVLPLAGRGSGGLCEWW